MENNSEVRKNADRFSGFADIYDKARSAVLLYPVKIICKYLGKRPDTVVDLGCGTGLSTVIWDGNCTRVIGIEPSADIERFRREIEQICGDGEFDIDFSYRMRIAVK